MYGSSGGWLRPPLDPPYKEAPRSAEYAPMADGVTEEDLRDWVRSFVWTGEYHADEIPWLIEDSLFPGDTVDQDWLRDVIAAEIAAKREAERAWPPVTDCDRLDRVFLALQRQGIIALHRAGFTQSDGLEEVEDDYHETGGEASGYSGHCFYTEQDQKGALDGSGMHIGFGHVSGDDTKGVEVGRLLQAALEAEGFGVEWNGTIGSRLFIKGFRWQRRGPQ